MFPFKHCKYTFVIKLVSYLSSISKMKVCDLYYYVAVEGIHHKLPFSEDLMLIFNKQKSIIEKVKEYVILIYL